MKSKIYIPVTIVILCIIGISCYFYSVKSPNVYHNNLLKYEVTIPVGWHVSEIMSKKMDISLNIAQLSSSIGCNISNMADEGLDAATLTRKLEDCLKNNKHYAQIEASNQEFQKNWRIDTAQSVYITRFTSDEENNFTLGDLSMPGDKLQKGSFFAIRPFESVLSFEEATSTNKTGLVRSFYILKDNTKTYLTDWRNSKISQSGLTLSIPITSNEQALWTGEGTIKSLIVITTATKDSQAEKDFYSLIDSIKIEK